MPPEIEELERMIDEVLALLDEALSIPSIPTERIEELLEALEYLNHEIELLEGGAETDFPTDKGQFPSSNVNGYAWNPKTGKMLVQFHGKYPQAEGPTYEYDDVDQNTFNIINKGQVAPRTSGKNGFHEWRKNLAPSHGASVYALLREGNK